MFALGQPWNTLARKTDALLFWLVVIRTRKDSFNMNIPSGREESTRCTTAYVSKVRSREWSRIGSRLENL